MRRECPRQIARPENCTVDGCNRRARQGGRCWGHKKQRQREMKRLRQKWNGDVDPDEVELPSRPLRTYGEHPRDRLAQAALAYAEAESDRDYTRAYDLLRKAAVRYTGMLAAR